LVESVLMATGTEPRERENAGDALPPAVATLLAGLAEGDAGRAAVAFAAAATYAYPAGEDDEIEERTSVAAAEIHSALAADPHLGYPRTVRVCCVEGTDCLVEGRILEPATEAPIRSFAASFQLDRSGSIARGLLFRVPVVEDAGRAGEPDESGTDIRRALDEYFADLQAARFEAAMRNYSEDCLYSHPPYSPGATRAEFRGRPELLAGFEARGPRPARIFIDLSIQRGADLMLEGHAFSDGTPEGPQSSFVSSVSVDPAGKIRRYVAFQCRGWERRRGGGEGR
jgi:hypothetical protein